MATTTQGLGGGQGPFENAAFFTICQPFPMTMFLLTDHRGLHTLRTRNEGESVPMFTHAQVWQGIDRLAAQQGWTASGLARRAGLDPTTFNPSKRITKQSKPRWPSTESLAKILNATSTSFEDFVALMADEAAPAATASQRLRCVALDQLERDGLFDSAGFPVGGEWDEIEFPNLEDHHGYALEVRGDSLAPTYRDGDLLILSPSAGIRRLDRVLLKSRAGEVALGTLGRRTARRIELTPFGEGSESRTFAVREVAWLARIVWASQ
jgi:phage repressor protein C with HTH and peptisase S24 domain